jgi:DNA-binding CsgD family transcriptional regulator
MTDVELASKVGLRPQTVGNERRRRRIRAFQRRGATVHWTEEMKALLGTDTDAAIADALGLKRGYVKQKRWLLGVPAYDARKAQPQVRWPPHARSWLGRLSDSEVARRLGVSKDTVTAKRRSLGIAGSGPSRRPFHWSVKRCRLLGRLADVEVAHRLGCDAETVRRKRRELGIAPLIVRRSIARTPALKRILLLPTPQLLERYGLWPGVVRRLREECEIENPRGHAARERRWTAALVARLGKEADVDIAHRMGVKPHTVRAKRQAMGIPRWQRPERRWTKAELALLGRHHDKEIARQLAMDPKLVAWKRRELSIAPLRRWDKRARRRRRGAS